MDSESRAHKHSPSRHLDADERAYLLARAALIVGLSVLYLLGIMVGSSALERNLYAAACGLLLLDTAVMVGLVFGWRVDLSRAMMRLAPPDLVAFAVFSYLGKPDDFFYPAVLVAPLLYALVVRKREAWLVGAGAATAYGVGLLFVGPLPAAGIALYVFKLVTIPVVTFLVASAVSKRRSREESAEHAVAETERLNSQLRRRVHELQAVSEITEIIHSSLDFDGVGARVLEIVASAIHVSTCCLFVIDKNRSETLFSASRGTSLSMPDSEGVAAVAEVDDQHLTCIPVFDHGPTMVLFCATPDALENLSDEERLVLGAVASELVVAVENSRLYKLTRRLAITDELTGLANYRHLQQRLDEELARAERYKKHVSLLMLDADDFKEFNDRQGHVAGDVALAELGPVIRGMVREVDLVARYGGEEFSVVLPETDTAGAYVVAEKIREAVEQHSFADADGNRGSTLTISVGVATYPTHGRDKDSLLREADDALYQAKRGGKNHVRAPKRHIEAHPGIPAAPAPNPATDEWMGV